MAVTLTRDNLWVVTISWEDKAGKGFTTFNIGETSGALPDPTDASFITYLSEMIDNAEGFSDCRVTDVSVSLHSRVTGSAGYGASPQVERKGVFQFDTASGFPSLVSVPGLSDAALANDGINIQRTGTVFAGTLAAALQGFHDKLQNGVTIGLVTFPVVDSRGSDYNGLLDAYQQHRRSSRG